jgi:hypothetical protein
MNPTGGPDPNDRQGRRQLIHPETHQPLPLRKQPGYYPGFSTLKQQAFWDEATRTKVLQRVQETPPIRFFNPRGFWCKRLKSPVHCRNARDDGTDLGTRSLQGAAF